MNESCTIQLFHEVHWRDIAEVTLRDDPKKGWRAKTTTGYAETWVLDHMGRRDAHAMGSRFPISFAAVTRPHWPVFLFDMLPQGYGRSESLRQPGLSETAAELETLIAGLLAMVTPLETVAARGTDFGLSKEVHAFLVPHINAQCRALARLASVHG